MLVSLFSCTSNYSDFLSPFSNYITTTAMPFLRKHWFDLGGVLALAVLLLLLFRWPILTDYQLLMWMNLVSLFAHQLEEYRVVGTFPGMINRVMFNSPMPDRFPLNTNTSFYINVVVGWGVYLLAALWAENAVWLGIAAILVSLGNTVAHTFLFNLKGKTFYNAGMATSWFLFVPITYSFFTLVSTHHLATTTDYLLGISLGILLNVVGILKMIDWLKDKNTPYIFPQRCLLPEDRHPYPSA